MTRYLLTFSLLYFLFTSQISVCQRINFSQIYGLSEFKSFSVVQAPDGGYVMAGGLSMLNGSDFVIVKTDSLGNFQWANGGNRFDGFNFDNTMFSITYLDNYYYLTGQIIVDAGAYNTKAYFAKCDTLGNVIWDRIDSSLSSWGTRIIRSSDNKLLFTGFTANNYSGILNNSWYGKIDTSGNLLWSAVLPDSVLIDATAIEEKNGRYFVSARSFVDTGQGYIYGSHLYCVDSLGNSYWNFSETDTSNNGIAELILDSGFIYAAQYYAVNFYNNTAYNSSVLKFDTLGNLIWRNTLNNLHFRGRGDNMSLIKTSDDNLLAVCRGVNYAKLDKNGQDIWTFEPDSVNYQVTQSILNRSGHCIATGYFTLSGMTDYSFLREVSDTSTTFMNELFLKNQLRIYPNPFVNSIILFSEFLHEMPVDIYNSMGVVIFNLKVRNGFNNIDLSHLPDGMYFLTINNLNHTFLYRIIKDSY